MECKRILSVLLTILTILCTSCEKECCCPPGCTKCDDCWCDCHKAFRSRKVFVKILHSDGITADSYHLSVNERSYDFMGNTKEILLDAEYSNILCYNNDGETVVIDGNYATTHFHYDSDSISYEPSPFYKIALQGYEAPVTDTLQLRLLPMIKEYRIITMLTNNDKDNRITGCSGIIVSGMAKGIHLWTDECYGRTAHLLQPNMADSSLSAAMFTWGRGEGRQALQYIFRQGGKTCRYAVDISEQIARLPDGGDIYVSINVEDDIEDVPSGGGTGGFDIGTEDWHNENTTIDI